MPISAAVKLLLIALSAAAAGFAFVRAERSAARGRRFGSAWLLAAAALMALPIPAALLAPGLREVLVGTEGVLEAITEGLLVAVLCLAIPRGLYPVAVAAFVLLLEELEYGMLFTGYPDAAVLESFGMPKGRFNFHNTTGESLWKLLPVGALIALSLPRLRAIARRCRLPALHRGVPLALLVTIALGFATTLLSGPRPMNEAMELALVAVFLVAWATAESADVGQAAPAANDPSER